MTLHPSHDAGSEPIGAIDAVAAELEAAFADDADFTARAARVLAFGRALARLPPDLCCERTRIRGCQSQVWLDAALDRDSGRLRLAADSDSPLMRGLLALVLRLYADRRPDEILAHAPGIVDRLLVGRSLAPSRANGLHLVVREIRRAAAASLPAQTDAQRAVASSDAGP